MTEYTVAPAKRPGYWNVYYGNLRVCRLDYREGAESLARRLNHIKCIHIGSIINLTEMVKALDRFLADSDEPPSLLLELLVLDGTPEERLGELERRRKQMRDEMRERV